MNSKILPKQLISEIWRPEPDASERPEYYRFERNEIKSFIYKIKGQAKCQIKIKN